MISDFLTKSNIKFYNKITKNKIIRDLVNLTCKDFSFKVKEKIIQDLIKREKIQSSGVGKGIAIPHYKSNFTNEIKLSVAICKNGIDFNAPDNIKVSIVFFIICPEDKHELYINMLSKIGRLSNDLKSYETILKSTEPEQVLKVLRQII